MLTPKDTQTLGELERKKHIDEIREAIEVGAIWREAYCAGFADGFKMAEKLIKG